MKSSDELKKIDQISENNKINSENNDKRITFNGL